MIKIIEKLHTTIVAAADEAEDGFVTFVCRMGSVDFNIDVAALVARKAREDAGPDADFGHGTFTKIFVPTYVDIDNLEGETLAGTLLEYDCIPLAP